MKKVLIFVLAFCLMAGLVACSAGGDEGADAPEPTTEPTVEQTIEPTNEPIPPTAAPADELLSTFYAQMFRSGTYQYSYTLTYEGINYIMTLAVKDDMLCREVVSEDGTLNQRVLSRDGVAYQIDNLTGSVLELGAEQFETSPDFASTLTFVNAKTLDTGAVAEAYDYTYKEKPCNIVFVFSEGKLVEFVATANGTTTETFIIEMTGSPDMSLFDIPQ